MVLTVLSHCSTLQVYLRKTGTFISGYVLRSKVVRVLRGFKNVKNKTLNGNNVTCACVTAVWLMVNLTPREQRLTAVALLIRHSRERSHVRVHSARESALFFSSGGAVGRALKRIEID